MQEFTVQYKHLTDAILPQKPVLNTGGLEDCFGLKPHEGRLVEPLRLVNPRAMAPGFPFPQLFCGSSICWLEENKIRRLNNDFDLLSTLAVTAGLTWHVIDFGQYVLFTNGVVIAELSDAGVLALNTTLPRFSTGCNFRGQLFVGGFFNSFNGFGLGAVAWSKIGRLDFSLDKSNTAGMVNLGTNAEVLRVLEHKNFVVVYTTRGVHKFYPTSEHVVGFGHEQLQDIPGIVSRDGVASNGTEHLMMDATGVLWVVSVEHQKRLGYQHIFGSWTGCDVIITYNKTEQSFDITNGESSYRLTASGLCRINQAITSQEHIPGNQIGLFEMVDGDGFLLVTNEFDFGFRGMKTLTGVEIAGVFSAPVFVSVDWKTRQDKYFRSTPWVRLNPEGFVRPRVCAEDFRIKVQSASNVGVVVDYAAIKYQINDKRNMRGSVRANTTNAGADSE